MIELPEESTRVSQWTRGMIEELQQKWSPEDKETIVRFALEVDDVAVQRLEQQKGNDEQYYQSCARG